MCLYLRLCYIPTVSQDGAVFVPVHVWMAAFLGGSGAGGGGVERRKQGCLHVTHLTKL